MDSAPVAEFDTRAVDVVLGSSGVELGGLRARLSTRPTIYETCPHLPSPHAEPPRQLLAATDPAIRLVATAGSGRGSPGHRAYQVKRPPIPRRWIHEIYWSFASERQAAFERRLADRPFPWTEDPILQEYKFCNVYRAADRVSQYMIREVCHHDEPCSPEDRIFQIVAFRTFSKIDTWTAVRAFLGHYPTLDDLADDGFREALDHARLQNGGLYTGAFVLCANNAYGRSCKHLNHVELFRHMFLQDALGERVLEALSLHQVYELLHGYPLMGDFMSYQTAIDLNYSDLINFSENEFTKAGPGALRGINKVFESLGDYTPADIIHWMVDHQEAAFESLGLPFNGLWGRPLHAIDCQGLFCETDKYCREAVPELASARKRIKARFFVTPEPIKFFFPPKWGINDNLPESPVLGATSQRKQNDQESPF